METVTHTHAQTDTDHCLAQTRSAAAVADNDLITDMYHAASSVGMLDLTRSYFCGRLSFPWHHGIPQ